MQNGFFQQRPSRKPALAQVARQKLARKYRSYQIPLSLWSRDLSRPDFGLMTTPGFS